MNCIRINQADNVAVALEPVTTRDNLSVGVTALQDIPQGHKIALNAIAKGQPVIKYGYPIGYASCDIAPGEWVHTHNIRTGLNQETDYSYIPVSLSLPAVEPGFFDGFLRTDGRAAIRNEVWLIPTVGCVNGVCRALACTAHEHRPAGVDGIYAFEHPYGCSQMGDDHAQTRRLLSALVNHPNAAAVLVVSLGCENNSLDSFKQELGSWDNDRVRFMVCQECEDELHVGGELLNTLMNYAAGFKRQSIPLSKLVVGMKCGGSDGLSGITANPVVGTFSDLLVAHGGSAILTEIPEMFGAEQLLLGRCASREVFDKAANMLHTFKQYFVEHGQVVYENPSPGNKQGGISTLEDKSLGCVQKGGRAPVTGIIQYGGQIEAAGLNLLCGPGNDLVSATALTAAGAHLILFTTGRGTPFGAPVPTAKLASNTALAEKKNNWIDFNAGTVAEGESVESTANRLLAYVTKLASGTVLTKAEKEGYREIAIFKDGVTL
ncbi:MAG: altronate dehydratase family protein [Angelakisella sp.]